jgi:ATPase family associated with various cellular activities (AAA)/Winged helix domain, variant
MSLAVGMTDRLTEALERLDTRLHREIRRLRTRATLSLDELRGLYISDEHVERLLAASGDGGAGADAEGPSPAAALAGDARWQHVSAAFELGEFDLDVLLLALAREIDAKYDTLFGYLNDDVTRKWPTRALVLRLCAADEATRRMLRGRLGERAPLLSAGLIRVLESAEHPSWLASGLVLPPLVSHYLLGLDDVDRHVPPVIETLDGLRWDEVPVTANVRARLERLPRLLSAAAGGSAPLVALAGVAGSGRTRATSALARALGAPAIALDFGGRLPAEQWAECTRTAVLYQRLVGAVILLRGVDAWWDREGALRPEVARVLAALSPARGAVVLAVEPGGRWRDALGRRRVVELALDIPPAPARRALWAQALDGRPGTPAPDEPVLAALADRFALPPGQIERAAQAADDARAIEGQQETPPAGALFEAARARTRDALGALAVRAATMHDWDDLVLPPPTLRVLREIAEAVRHRGLVLDAWGFARRIPSAKGLKVLFAGGSGTGKTMAAAVIARELDVDLFVIDLAGVVSKYIGETEKNLDRIFRAAWSANAILFFDEADALFGKRSEVKDAHDRYANIEVAYLLQKMEAHEGVVILASNLPRNLDAAFARRMQYVVEFAPPGEADRERLWRGMFPPETPLGEDVDLPFLAQHFPLSGGEIRNVVLDAAFLAAQNGRVVRMPHLVRAMARQITKQGRVPAAGDFKHYHALIDAAE